MQHNGNEKPIRLLIADDHELVRDGIRARLESEGGIEIVGEARNGVELVGLARIEAPSRRLRHVARHQRHLVAEHARITWQHHDSRRNRSRHRTRAGGGRVHGRGWAVRGGSGRCDDGRGRGEIDAATAGYGESDAAMAEYEESDTAMAGMGGATRRRGRATRRWTGT